MWQCGGSVEVLPCARIAHIERAHKPYTEDLTVHVRRNALRVAEVWMDEFKSHVYMAWNIPQEVRTCAGFKPIKVMLTFIHVTDIYLFLNKVILRFQNFALHLH